MAAVSMDGLMSVVQRYQMDVEKSVERLRQKGAVMFEQGQRQLGNFIGQLSVKVPSELEQLKTTTIADLSDPSSPPEKADDADHYLAEVYVWTACCLFGLSVGQLVSSMLLSPLLFSLLLSTTPTLLLIYVLVPIYVYEVLRTNQLELAEGDQRCAVLAFSLFVGLLSGHLFAETYLRFWPPIAFVWPACAAFAIGLHLVSANNRPALIGVVVGGSAGLQLLLGLLLGQLGFAYIVWTLLFAGMLFVSVQLTLGRLASSAPKQALVELVLVYGVLMAGDMLTLFFGTDKQTADKYKEQQQNQ